MADKIVSIGLLTERDLAALGKGFHRHFPVDQDDLFKDLIEKLDQIPFPPRQDGSDKA